MHVGIVSESDVDSSFDLANVLHQAGAAVTLYLSYARTARSVGSPDRPLETLTELGLLDPGIQTRLFRFPRMRDPRSLRVVRTMIQAMHADKIDVAHILAGDGELWLAVLACLLRDIPTVSTMIIPNANVGGGLPAWWVRATNHLVARGSGLTIVNGERQVAQVQQMYHVPANRLSYVPLCARTTAVRWARNKTPEEPGTILFFGRVEPHKGLEYLVRAQPRISRCVPEARIVISGYGSDLERCRRMIQDESKFEIHEGYASGAEMAGFFQRAGVVVLPYISASTSGILGTAFVFSKPVVATRVGCLPEYVQDGVTGLLVPPRDIERLADAIVRVLSEDDLRHTLGENAGRWIDEQQRQIAASTCQVYDQCIHLRRNERGA